MNDNEAKQMMQQCVNEIEDLRRYIAKLEPKAEAYEMIKEILDLLPKRGQGAAPDIVWQLRKRIKELEEKKSEPSEDEKSIGGTKSTTDDSMKI